MDIKTGIAGIIAMMVIVIIVLTVNTATLNANAVVQDLNYKGRTILTRADLTLTIPECEYNGVRRCREHYLEWKYPQKNVFEDYEDCANYVKSLCNDASKYYAYIV